MKHLSFNELELIAPDFHKWTKSFFVNESNYIIKKNMSCYQVQFCSNSYLYRLSFTLPFISPWKSIPDSSGSIGGLATGINIDTHIPLVSSRSLPYTNESWDRLMTAIVILEIST